MTPFIRITNLSRESIDLKLSDLRFVDLPTDSAEGRRTELQLGDVLISITADMSNQRMGHAAGWYGVLGTFGLGSALGAILGEGASAMIVIPAVAGGVGVVGTVGAAMTLARRRNRMELSVQGLLDRLERGTKMASEPPTLRERITDFLED